MHLGVHVEDLDRSRAFYAALGYEVVGEVPAAPLGSLTMLKLPGDEFVRIELVQNPTLGSIGPRGLSHLVIQVDDLHAKVADLGAKGVQVEEPTSPDGSDDFWTAWLDDPDGHRIELVQWPAHHPVGMTEADLTSPTS
ncbi:VOC family protein [Georgenia yuyongxinii]|uniref:VOC family protein n=1 Tax=Georgenia yuyongxinii TaxID=2589797 RepID=A0A5B8C3A6_9MICO|nr:VOC family protein [Georgenia yuyongxinii]QDC23981.1 VOC family protein [Georgenia yuyongxinii]